MTVTAATPRSMFIGGSWLDGESSFDDLNPATGEVWAQVANATQADARAAVESASLAQPAWAALNYDERARYLLKAADHLEATRERFVDAIVSEGGGWFGKAMFETGYVPGILRSAAALTYGPVGEILPSDHGKVMMVVREPVGVVTVISPWNFPLLLSMRAVAFALATGNAVILKPSEETPVIGGLLIAELFEAVGLPAGVLNVVTCSRDRVEEVGDELISNPKVNAVSFTGSTAVGRSIGAKAGGLLKKAALELGGKDALLILDDADMDRAVDAAVFGTYMHQGQICMSCERIIVDQSRAEEFTARFVERVRGLSVGDPSNPENMIGPIINQKQLGKIHSQVTEAIEQGATLLAGGEYEGLFYSPTVLSGVTPQMRVFQEETFGPVAPISIAADEDEAIALANNSEYGLAAGVITTDEERGLSVARRLHTGMVHLNDTSVYDEPHVPFGGVKNSGLGRHGGAASFDAFTETRWITLERGGRKYPF